MERKGDYAELKIAEIAARQHGVATQCQIRAVGVSSAAISKWVRRGRLHRVHQGVYAVGHTALGHQGRWMAAVLACGHGAVLSHASAAAHWGLLRPIEGPVDVSVPTQNGRRKRTGIRVHRCRSLAEGTLMTTRHRGIPITAPTRTLADLPATVSPRLVRRARRQAEVLGLPLGPEVATDRTRSDLERDFLRLCHRHGLPSPEVNVRIGRWTVDFLWAAERLIVETDGYRYHRGEVAFEDDRDRDLGFRSLGYYVLRLTERQVTAEAARVAALLTDELRARRAG